MIERLGSSGRRDTYRTNHISGISRPKGNRIGGNKKNDRLRRAIPDIAQRILHRAISDVAQSDTNQSNNQKQSTNPPTPKREQPSAIQPTAFRQSGVGEGESSVVDDERERMFEEFWTAERVTLPFNGRFARVRPHRFRLPSVRPCVRRFCESCPQT